MKSKILWAIIIPVLVVLFFAFYWWQVRPNMIKKFCARRINNNLFWYKWDRWADPRNVMKYEGCLHERGL